MKAIFKKRRQDFQGQALKYLRFVFNDHFTLFLLILLGALAVQYVQFLRSHSLNGWEKALLVLVVSLIALLPGRLATFIEAADKVFLLVKEREVMAYLRSALLRSLILPAVVSAVLIFVASPLLVLPVWLLILWFVILLLVKGGIFAYRLYAWQAQGVLDWASVIAYEENRRVSILRFFALFTNVKGLKSHSHRRKYLDFLLPKTKRTYEYLLSRSFLRSGDYLGLTWRLLLLSLLALIFVKNPIVAVILVCVLNALLIFQLLALREAMDYQLFTRIYPVNKATKAVAVRRILRRVMILLSVIQLIVGLIFLQERLYLLAVVLVNFVLVKFYVAGRLKK